MFHLNDRDFLAETMPTLVSRLNDEGASSVSHGMARAGLGRVLGLALAGLGRFLVELSGHGNYANMSLAPNPNISTNRYRRTSQYQHLPKHGGRKGNYRTESRNSYHVSYRSRRGRTGRISDRWVVLPYVCRAWMATHKKHCRGWSLKAHTGKQVGAATQASRRRAPIEKQHEGGHIASVLGLQQVLRGR